MVDADGDGYGSETPGNANATAGTDCSDPYDYYHPFIAYNEADPSLCMRDYDGDGYGAALAYSGGNTQEQTVMMPMTPLPLLMLMLMDTSSV